MKAKRYREQLRTSKDKSPVEPLMSALGQKQTSKRIQPTSALHPKADIAGRD
jgi:hypothetical protein